MTALYLDIETIPTQQDRIRDHISASLREQFLVDMETIRAPANYKDEAKITEYVATKKKELQDGFAQAVADKIAATGLDGAFGHIFCLGWAFDDSAAQTIYGTDEKAVLREFSDAVRVVPNEQFNVTVIGHNVAAFDLRFLAQRYIVHGIRPPMHITRAAQAKPWETEKVYDTMVQWAGVGNRVSLDKLCIALSIESPKGEFDGSMVAQLVADGRHGEVAKYCKRDVEAVRKVHRRMTFADTVQQQTTEAEAA